MAKAPRINSKDAGRYVRQLLPFNANGTLWAEYRTVRNARLNRDEKLYIVFSYGEHWPLYVCSDETGLWYRNTDKTSVTTSAHAGKADPGVQCFPRTCEEMKQIVQEGT